MESLGDLLDWSIRIWTLGGIIGSSWRFLHNRRKRKKPPEDGPGTPE